MEKDTLEFSSNPGNLKVYRSQEVFPLVVSGNGWIEK